MYIEGKERGYKKMKKQTYRCEDDKYKELQKRLIDDDMSFQGFTDWCVSQYLRKNYNPKEEMEMLRVFKSENGQKIYVENGVVARHEHCSEVVEYSNHEGKKWDKLQLEGFKEITDSEQLKIEAEFLEECKYYQSKENPYK